MTLLMKAKKGGGRGRGGGVLSLDIHSPDFRTPEFQEGSPRLYFCLHGLKLTKLGQAAANAAFRSLPRAMPLAAVTRTAISHFIPFFFFFVPTAITTPRATGCTVFPEALMARSPLSKNATSITLPVDSRTFTSSSITATTRITSEAYLDSAPELHAGFLVDEVDRAFLPVPRAKVARAPGNPERRVQTTASCPAPPFARPAASVSVNTRSGGVVRQVSRSTVQASTDL